MKLKKSKTVKAKVKASSGAPPLYACCPSKQDLAVLQALHKYPGISARLIADRLEVHPSTITTPIDRLKKKGLIVVTGIERKGRGVSKQLELSEQGKLALSLLKTGKYKKMTVIIPA